MLSKCFCVVIALKDIHVSSGQLVILQAMKYGKPVVVNSADGISDYIENGATGIIVNKTKQEFLDAIDFLKTHPEEYARISNNAKQKFRDCFSIEAMALNIGDLIKSKY